MAYRNGCRINAAGSIPFGRLWAVIFPVEVSGAWTFSGFVIENDNWEGFQEVHGGAFEVSEKGDICVKDFAVAKALSEIVSPDWSKLLYWHDGDIRVAAACVDHAFWVVLGAKAAAGELSKQLGQEWLEATEADIELSGLDGYPVQTTGT